MGRLLRIAIALALLAVYGLPAQTAAGGTVLAQMATHGETIAVHGMMPAIPGDAVDHTGHSCCMACSGIVALATDGAGVGAPFGDAERGPAAVGIVKDRAVAPDPHPPKRA